MPPLQTALELREVALQKAVDLRGVLAAFAERRQLAGSEKVAVTFQPAMERVMKNLDGAYDFFGSEAERALRILDALQDTTLELQDIRDAATKVDAIGLYRLGQEIGRQTQIYQNTADKCTEERERGGELNQWLSAQHGPIQFSPVSDMRCHRILNAQRHNELAWMHAAGRQHGDTVKEKEFAAEFDASAGRFMLTHDLAGCFQGDPGFDESIAMLPYPRCVFEVMLNGKHVILFAKQTGEEITMLSFVLVEGRYHALAALETVSHSTPAPRHDTAEQVAAAERHVDIEACKQMLENPSNISEGSPEDIKARLEVLEAEQATTKKGSETQGWKKTRFENIPPAPEKVGAEGKITLAWEQWRAAAAEAIEADSQERHKKSAQDKKDSDLQGAEWDFLTKTGINRDLYFSALANKRLSADLWAQVRAMVLYIENRPDDLRCVTAPRLQTEREAKLNILPMMDYHLLDLSRHARLQSSGDGTVGVHKRAHWTRGHWRNFRHPRYKGHPRIRIAPHISGDFDLGFVDKAYRLGSSPNG